MDDRIQKTQKLLFALELDYLLFEDSVSLFYLTGLDLSAGRLAVGKKSVCLFVDSRYFEAAKKRGVCRVEKKEDAALEAFLLQDGHAGKIGVDGALFTYNAFVELRAVLQKIGGGFALVPQKGPINALRLIKDPKEIAAMKSAARIAHRGYLHLCTLLKPGVSEKMLAGAFEIYCVKEGADKLAFDPIICFGKNAAEPHHKPDGTILSAGDGVLMDIGVVVDGYHSDMTRVALLEKSTLLADYEAVKQAQSRALSLCRPGTTLGELDLAAHAALKEYGHEELFTHALGHGVGLTTHELFSISSKGENRDMVLRSGMTLTIEPGLYRPGIGGVRYEDTILITEDGYENFYPAS